MIKIHIDNYGHIFGKNMPEALGKLDRLMREKFNDSVPGALYRGSNRKFTLPARRRRRRV